eukprot:COSAG01_NODE_39_length_33243_cov_28.298558_2_plen_142_part_00
MSHLHTLMIKPQIYVDLLEGDTESPYYIYIGATEDYIRRYTQKIQGYDAYHSGDNDDWCTPLFCRQLHRVKQTLHVSFVNGGKACGDAERDTLLTYFHDCNLDVIRGADWCRIKKSVIDGLYNKYTVRIGWPLLNRALGVE